MVRNWLARLGAMLCAVTLAQEIQAQVPAPPPLTLTLQDALDRAKTNAPLVAAAINEANSAREDVVQARAALRPTVSFLSEYLNTQGNGKIPSGRFVSNDGVHLYRDWAVVRQDFTAAILRTGPKRATEAEALAVAKADIARRGLAVTVTRAYYALLASQRKYATAQLALDQARRYLELSQALERGGEVAHSDVVKSELLYTSQDQAFREAKITMDNARLDLAVLLFRDFDQNFTVVDDLNLAPALPAFTEVQTMAGRENPEIRAANAALRAAKLDVTIARQASLPSLTADLAYGIEANAFAFHSTVAADPEVGKVPNLGYFATLSLNIPLWDWGGRSSKVRQAEIKRDQANVELSAAQRELIKNLLSYYQEAQGARDLVDLLRRSADLAAESLRLNALRYQAGEISILELVDAQTTVTQTRNAYDEGVVRYRLALANLQTLTGTF